ncbi:hypothetical protein M8C21_016387, partial [Ambrosia artemisiifolia]
CGNYQIKRMPLVLLGRDFLYVATESVATEESLSPASAEERFLTAAEKGGLPSRFRSELENLTNFHPKAGIDDPNFAYYFKYEEYDFFVLTFYPVVPEDRQLLSVRSSAAAVIPTGLLVDTNLDTSIPDTYRHPPPPVPYDANPQAPPKTERTLPIRIIPLGENVAKEPMESVATEEFDVVLDKSDELKKSNTPFVSPEECPTCLE